MQQRYAKALIPKTRSEKKKSKDAFLMPLLYP